MNPYPNQNAGQLGNAQNYVNASNLQAAVPQTDLESFKSRLAEIMNFTQNQGERVDIICAKLTGGGGGSVGTKTDMARPIATGMLAELNNMADDILSRLQRTDETVTRLRQAI